MLSYIKSLFPYRWIYIAILIINVELILFIGNTENIIVKNYFHIINICTWFIVDICFGLGREEHKIYKNIIGIVYLLALSITILLFTSSLKI